MRTFDMLPVALAGAFAVAVCAIATTPAMAQPTRALTDGEYIALARCAGTAHGLGADAAAYDKALDQQGGRNAIVDSQAQTQRDEAMQHARHAGPDTKARLVAEQEGACKAFVS